MATESSPPVAKAFESKPSSSLRDPHRRACGNHCRGCEEKAGRRGRSGQRLATALTASRTILRRGWPLTREMGLGSKGRAAKG